MPAHRGGGLVAGSQQAVILVEHRIESAQRCARTEDRRRAGQAALREARIQAAPHTRGELRGEPIGVRRAAVARHRLVPEPHRGRRVARSQRRTSLLKQLTGAFDPRVELFAQLLAPHGVVHPLDRNPPGLQPPLAQILFRAGLRIVGVGPPFVPLLLLGRDALPQLASILILASQRDELVEVVERLAQPQRLCVQPRPREQRAHQVVAQLPPARQRLNLRLHRAGEGLVEAPLLQCLLAGPHAHVQAVSEHRFTRCGRCVSQYPHSRTARPLSPSAALTQRGAGESAAGRLTF